MPYVGFVIDAKMGFFTLRYYSEVRLTVNCELVGHLCRAKFAVLRLLLVSTAYSFYTLIRSFYGHTT